MEILIRADKGKWLTDGKNYGKIVSLAKGISVDKYYEITEEEYEKIFENGNDHEIMNNEEEIENA